MFDLNKRAEATRKTLAKYRHKAFDWKAKVTCIHLARTHLRNMGHKPPVIPAFTSPIGAQRALLATGFGSLEGLLDSMLPRIAPAAMLVGDLALLQGDEGFDSIVVSAGGKLLGYHEADMSGLKPLIANEIKGAWRV
ncbi:MAG: DUF6950 family protein [Sphingobium sp.]